MPPILLTYDHVRAKGVPYSKCQLWRLEREGRFPRRVPLSAARHCWIEAEIDQWIASRVKAREMVAA